MKWHWLPVYAQDDSTPDVEGTRAYSLCEVYLDDDGKLHGWTEKMAIAPVGNDLNDLCLSLEQMLRDARRYEPVRFSELKPGMILKERTERIGDGSTLRWNAEMATWERIGA